jgi:hypothetical protein
MTIEDRQTKSLIMLTPSLILNNSFDLLSDSNIEVRDKFSWETKAYHDNVGIREEIPAR